MEQTTIAKDQADSCGIETKTGCKNCGKKLSQNCGDFCCPGCEVSYQVTKNFKTQAASNITNFAVHATLDANNNNRLTLMVGGIHCASCIKLIENALYSDDRVINARVNMSTSRLVITYKGEAEYGNLLANKILQLGYSLSYANDNKKQDNDNTNYLLKCLGVAGFASGNLMLISVGLWAAVDGSMGLMSRSLFYIISAMIAVPAVIYSGRPFFNSAWQVLKQKRTNMDVPISVGIILTTLMSIFQVIINGSHIYFESAVMLIFFLLAGRYFDAKVRAKAMSLASDLLSMLGGIANLRLGKKIKQIAVADIKPEMILTIAKGENIPADGVIIKGTTEIDMSLINGESVPQLSKPNDSVFAGTTNLSAPIEIKVSKATEDSLLSNIVKLMEKAEQGQAKYVRLADRVARLYTPVVHLLGLLTFLLWVFILGASWHHSIIVAITVLLITCPCALGLAVPVVQVLAISKLFKSGIIIKSGDALERLTEIDTVIFDKTGTITTNLPKLLKGKYTSEELAIAASLAANSKHPFSRAIVSAFNGELVNIDNVTEIAGVGLEGKYCGKAIKLGRLNLKDKADSKTAIYLSGYSKTPVRFAFSEELKEDAAVIIKQLNQSDIKTIIISGDIEAAVRDVAAKVGISDYYAAKSPIEKCNLIENYKAQGKKILMVGDGLNDAPSLKSAHISMSPSSAIDITQNSSDIVFRSENLAPIIDAYNTAKFATKLVKQNFALALIYNIIAIPVAVMGLVTPLIAAIAMSVSSLIVIANSYKLNLLKRTKGVR